MHNFQSLKWEQKIVWSVLEVVATLKMKTEN